MRIKPRRPVRGRGPFAVYGIRLSEHLEEPPQFPNFAAACRAVIADADGAEDVTISIVDRVGILVWSDTED